MAFKYNPFTEKFDYVNKVTGSAGGAVTYQSGATTNKAYGLYGTWLEAYNAYRAIVDNGGWCEFHIDEPVSGLNRIAFTGMPAGGWQWDHVAIKDSFDIRPASGPVFLYADVGAKFDVNTGSANSFIIDGSVVIDNSGNNVPLVERTSNNFTFIMSNAADIRCDGTGTEVWKIPSGGYAQTLSMAYSSVTNIGKAPIYISGNLTVNADARSTISTNAINGTSFIFGGRIATTASIGQVQGASNLISFGAAVNNVQNKLQVQYLDALEKSSNTMVVGGGFSDGISVPNDAQFEKRILAKQADDVASANDLVLGDGNTFVITGTTQINAISTNGWQSGSEINLIFNSTPTVKHNTAGGANTAPILLSLGLDIVAAAGLTLKLVLSIRGGVEAWREL